MDTLCLNSLSPAKINFSKGANISVLNSNCNHSAHSPLKSNFNANVQSPKKQIQTRTADAHKMSNHYLTREDNRS